MNRVIGKKVLWLINTILPEMAREMNGNIANGGGWIQGLLRDINDETIDLYVCSTSSEIDNIISKKINNINYYVIPKKYKDATKYDKGLERSFDKLLEELKPDLIHIFGTEYPHTLSMVKASNDYKRVISIQGLTSMCAEHYFNGLPEYVFKNECLKRYLRKNTIKMEKEKFKKRGKFEIEAINKIENVIGRTTWDKACSMKINKKIKYYFCNESLRGEFYNKKWSLESCERNSIFLSQGSYPIKGMHQMIKALPEIIKKFPNTHLYIGGEKIIYESSGIRKKIKNILPNYPDYLEKLLIDLDIYEYVTFLGEISEKEMCKRFLNSHVFVMPSSIENSPNSLGEAMILGVPSVSSCVGGVQDMIIDRKDGFVYPFDEYYMISKYICDIFDNDILAKEISENSRKHAMITHNKETNKNQLLSIYSMILGE